MTWPTGEATAIRLEAWATPAPGVTLVELIREFQEAGVSIIDVDMAGGRVKIVDTTEPL